MFQFAGLAEPYLCIQYGLVRESWDQMMFVSSPKLFADFHALRRLLMPRHPPYALNSLTTYIQSSPRNYNRSRRREESRDTGISHWATRHMTVRGGRSSNDCSFI